MKKTEYDAAQVEELLPPAPETEIGGIEIYTQALRCAVNPDLQREWQPCLTQTTRHRAVLRGVFEQLGLDPAVQTPGRKSVAYIGSAVVKVMQLALNSADARGAELVAG